MAINKTLVLVGTILCATCATMASAAAETSNDDRAFVAMVSQGGMFEVALGKVAERHGSTQDIKDQGSTETHDHERVGAKLKTAARQAGIEFSNDLNATFKARLAAITSLSGEAFDKAYLDEMKKIHAADGAAFLKEFHSGSNASLKSFAGETYNIVQRHIGELNAETIKTE